MSFADEIYSNRVCLPKVNTFLEQSPNCFKSQNCSKTLLNIRPICRPDIENDETIAGNVQLIKPPIYKQVERIERAFVGNTPSLWVSLYSELI